MPSAAAIVGATSTGWTPRWTRTARIPAPAKRIGTRRDYVHVYEGPALKSVVKNKYKMHLPPPGSNPIAAEIFDLYRDPREEHGDDSIKYGPWAGGQFAAMVKRHLAYQKKYPNRPPVRDVPYGGIEDLRPETKALLKHFIASLPGAK